MEFIELEAVEDEFETQRDTSSRRRNRRALKAPPPKALAEEEQELSETTASSTDTEDEEEEATPTVDGMRNGAEGRASSAFKLGVVQWGGLLTRGCFPFPFKARRRAPKPVQRSTAKRGEERARTETQNPATMSRVRQHRSKPIAKKRPRAAIEDEEEDVELVAQTELDAIKKSRPTHRERSPAPVPSEPEDGLDEEPPSSDTDAELVIDETSQPAIRQQDPILYGGQKALACIERICTVLDLKWQGCTLKPDDAIWSKMGGTFMRKSHPEYRLTFSSFDSFHIQIGRFIAAMVYAKCDLAPKFIPGGVHVWRHGWLESGVPRCLHGVEMTLKPRTVELNPSSEAGKRAMAEQNGIIEKNRFGRQVVVLRFDKNVVCFKDANHSGFPHPHAAGSCCMSFSDGQKALSALTHDVQWTKALYPNADAKRAEECVLMCTACCCNYSNESAVAGRQTCRMTPYRLSGVDDISSEMIKTRRDMRAHKENPHTMVFTCCNPQTPQGGMRGGNAKKTEKSCGWRLSAMDLRYAYVFANELFVKVFGKPFRTNITEFKWNDSFAFKTDVIHPIEPIPTTTDLFA